ncbi:MAG: LEA type 2 family protein [Gammaproteobacteria bacterium]|nr:MAG: LEA type 2 family protein [Gammaproteobacteria bacterium]
MGRGLLIACVGALLTGCAIMGGLSEPPRVSLASIAPVDLQLFEQRFRVTLRVQNPNSKDITIRGLDYEIVVNDKLFAQGVSGKPFTIPANGESAVEVEVVSTLQRVMEQLQELGNRGKPSIDYAISGRVSIDGIPVPVPFDYRDTLTLPGFEERENKDGNRRLPKPNEMTI